jgi:hypothetical protein
LIADQTKFYSKGEIIMARPKGDDNVRSCIGLKIQIYVCESWTGDLREQVLQILFPVHMAYDRTEEMEPSWFSFAKAMRTNPSQNRDTDIPFDEMVFRSCSTSCLC